MAQAGRHRPRRLAARGNCTRAEPTVSLRVRALLATVFLLAFAGAGALVIRLGSATPRRKPAADHLQGPDLSRSRARPRADPSCASAAVPAPSGLHARHIHRLIDYIAHVRNNHGLDRPALSGARPGGGLPQLPRGRAAKDSTGSRRRCAASCSTSTATARASASSSPRTTAKRDCCTTASRTPAGRRSSRRSSGLMPAPWFMVRQLREQNQRLLKHSERTIEASVGAVGLIFVADPRLPALGDEPPLRLAAARHRVGDPRRPLLPPAHGRAPRRDRPARHALQPHGRAPPGPRPADSREERRDRGGEPQPPRPQRNPRGEGRRAHARSAGVARAGPAHQRRARGFQAPSRSRQPGPRARQPGQGQLPVDHLPRAQNAALGHQRLSLPDPRRTLRERRSCTCARRFRSPSAAASSSRA